MTIRVKHHHDPEKGDRIHLVTNETGRIEKMLGAEPHQHAPWQLPDGDPDPRARSLDITDGWKTLASVFREDNTIEVAQAIEDLAYELFGRRGWGRTGDTVSPQEHRSPVSMIVGFIVPTTKEN